MKSTSPATAARAVNVLRCGVPVREWSSLDGAGVIVLHVPTAAVKHTVAELAGSGIRWRGKTVVIYDAVLDASALRTIENDGAACASLCAVSDNPLLFLLEGSPAAVRDLRPLLQGRDASILEIARGGKAEYLAGAYEATAAFLPRMHAAVEHFRSAGLDKGRAESLAAHYLGNSIRAYLRSGKRVLALATAAGKSRRR